MAFFLDFWMIPGRLGRDWCEGGCRPRPQVAGQKPNLALIPGDSAKGAEVVYCDAAGVQLAVGGCVRTQIETHIKHSIW